TATSRNPAAAFFVVLANAARPERKSVTLAEAVAEAQSGDTIEIRGNGPFICQPIDLKDKALTLRAGQGYRPVLELDQQRKTASHLLQTEARLTLEGLTLRRQGDHKLPLPWPAIVSTNGPLYLTHCDLAIHGVGQIIGTNHAILQLRQCKLYS